MKIFREISRSLALISLVAQAGICSEKFGDDSVARMINGDAVKILRNSSSGKEATCSMSIAPVIHLGYGSRYIGSDKSRSILDTNGNASVEWELQRLDDFVSLLASLSNRAAIEDSYEIADCVTKHITAWADADALSGLDSLQARLTVPSRLSGIAFAYSTIEPMISSSDPRHDAIRAWLRRRSYETIDAFDHEAPKRAARNNLRAWAALEALRIGITVKDPALLDWGRRSLELVACQAERDGALPLEMERGRLALHYQIHATAPLVISAALLSDEGDLAFEICDRAIPRIVDFVVSALDDHSILVGHTDETQELGALNGSDLAWAVAFLRWNESPDLRKLIAGYPALRHSKYGGDQKLLWAGSGG